MSNLFTTKNEALEAVKKDGTLLFSVSEEVLDKEIIIEAVRNHVPIHLLSDELILDEDIQTAALACVLNEAKKLEKNGASEKQIEKFLRKEEEYLQSTVAEAKGNMEKLDYNAGKNKQ